MNALSPKLKLVEVRNIIAHSAFGPDDDGARNYGIIFDTSAGLAGWVFRAGANVSRRH
jgi:hypothetical protein